MSADSPEGEDVIRAHRVEILDGHGRVRAVLGDLDSPTEGPPDFGLQLLGARGERRAWLSVGALGPVLGLDEGGNTAVEIGVADPDTETLHTGAYLVLSDRTGGLAVGWWVAEDGTVTMRTGTPGR